MNTPSERLAVSSPLSRMLLPRVIALVLLWACSAELAAAPPKLPHAKPEEAGMNTEKLAEVDTVVSAALEEQKMRGCVVLISRQGKTVFLRAYGNKSVEPEMKEMTIDAIFDMASITKPVATATSVMLLVERGKLGLDETAAKYWPEFASHGKDAITVRQLLTHQAGLIADNSIGDYTGTREEMIARIASLKLLAQPGEKFVYSDVSFIVLAELVHRVSGQHVDEFAAQNLFQPLGMNDTMFLLPDELKQRAVPTEKIDGQWRRGDVHDPRAYRLDGVAGHAGLFSTAEDMAVFGQMLLGGGTYSGVRILSPKTVETMTSPHPVPGRGVRGLGWDMKTGYSSNRGENYSSQAYGHGGFTGTVFWNDPQHGLTVVFLSSRLHPDGRGSVNPLAGRIGTIAVEAIGE